MNKKVVILNFSHRKDGNCGRISEFLLDYYNRTNGRLYSVASVPCGGCDYECLKPGVSCPTITPEQIEIMDAVKNSDLTYYVLPNFCGYPCANYFAFNERSVGYFNSDRTLMNQYMSVPKRFIVVSNSEGDNFRNALQQQTNQEPMIQYMKSGKYKKRSTAGDIMDSEDAIADLNAFLEAHG